MKLKSTILLLIVIFLLIYSEVQSATDKDSTALKKEKNFKITPFVAPGYTPELGFLITAGGLASFKTNADDDDIQRSSIPFTIAYTTTKAIVGSGILSSYWFGDKMRIYGDFWYKDMPDNYWGIGYDKAATVPKSDTTTAYIRQWLWINPRFVFQVKKSYFIGLNIDYNYTHGTEASAGVAADSIYQLYNNKPMNSGVGLILRYDSRDIPVNAWSGLLLDLRTTIYNTAFGGDNNYQMFLLDYRQYQTLSRPGQVIAWQIKTRLTFGSVPYGEMSQLGTPFDLRGYTWGRYRNNDMFFFIGEYRHTFQKKNGDLSRHGLVAWTASGTIFNTDSFKDNNFRWLPNFGIGYRFEVQPRMNIRLDFGIGRETTGIYFNFNEAF